MDISLLDAIITGNIRKEERGTASSFYSSARFLGVAAGPPIMALVMKKLSQYELYNCRSSWDNPIVPSIQIY